MAPESLGKVVDSNLGLASNLVRVAPYNPEWPSYFDAEEARLRVAFYSVDLQIAHIGSTAVPGLGAKPVVDIMIGLEDDHLLAMAEEVLISLGYEAKGEKGIPGRLFLTYGEPAIYHVHLVRVNEAFWHEHIFFRDQLREQKRIAEDYMEMKLNLARLFPNDRDAYTNGKAQFIEDVLATAGKSQ